MKTRHYLFGSILMACLIAACQFPLHAQRARQNSNSREGMVGQFNQSAPAVGDTLPLLNGFDAKGHPWNTGQLRGKHTVLVFGCLT